MGNRRRAVVSADAADLAEVEALVRDGRYANVSDFVRQAVAEKLRVERASMLAEEVEAYVQAGHASEDADLLAEQAFEPAPPGRKKSRRAKR